MEHRAVLIDKFFDEYERRFNQSLKTGEVDVNGTANSFAERFIESSPAGVVCGKNNFIFRLMIPRGFKYYRKIGTIDMSISSRQITHLDDGHAMAKIHWKSTYKKKDASQVQIEFDVIYLLRTTDEIKIFAYITGDEQKVLREHGWIK